MKMPVKYKCMECDNDPYDKEADLGKHLMWEHGYGEKIKINKITKFRCVLCDEIYDDENKLAEDLMWNHGLAVEIPEEQK